MRNTSKMTTLENKFPLIPDEKKIAAKIREMV